MLRTAQSLDGPSDRHEKTATNYLLALEELTGYLADQFGVEFSMGEGILADVHRAAAHLALQHVKVAAHAGGAHGPIAGLWIVSANPREPHILQAPSYIAPARVRDATLEFYATWKSGQKRYLRPYFLSDWRPSHRLDFPLTRGVVRFMPSVRGPGRVSDHRGRHYSLHRAEARGASLQRGDRVQFVATTDLTSERGWRWATMVRRVEERRARLAA